MDVMMPEMDGYDACTHMRQHARGAPVPILMLTGLEDLDSINRAYEVGATDFISKPINWGVLGHRVRYILRASQAFGDLAKHQASLENAQRIAHLGSWEWDLKRDEIYWSAETFRILGLAADSVPVGFEPFLECVHPEDRSHAQDAIRHLLRTGQYSGKGVRIVRMDGTLRHVQLQGVGSVDGAARSTHIGGTIQDVTEIKEAEERIRFLAYYDGTTGLPNRQYFLERLNHTLVRSRRASTASWACSRWISTSSSASTTRSATARATSC